MTIKEYLKSKIAITLYVGLCTLFSPNDNLSYINQNNNKTVIIQNVEEEKAKKEDSEKLRIKTLMPRSERYLDSLFAYSNTYGTKPEEIAAIIQNESNWDIYATSHKGAKGLMQLNPRYHKTENPYNPYQNMKVGIPYYENLSNKYNKKEISLAAWNAGPSKVDKWIKNGWNGEINKIPYKETRRFVRRVTLTLEELTKYQ